jgi:prevent-host-death family protein
MPKTTKEALPISSLSSETQRLVKQVRSSGRPLHITSRGQPAAVLVDAEDFELQQERLEIMKHIARGKRDIAAGRTYSQEEVESLLSKWLDGSEA